MQLLSNVFEAGGRIPTIYTCEGDNLSPPLSWRGVPPEAETLVIICDDPDAGEQAWSHWVLYNVPASKDRVPEGYPAGEESPDGVAQGRNDFGRVGYEGPCPPRGADHRYYFRLYALDQRLEISPGATRQQVLDAIDDHVLARTELMARYARPEPAEVGG